MEDLVEVNWFLQLSRSSFPNVLFNCYDDVGDTMSDNDNEVNDLLRCNRFPSRFSIFAHSEGNVCLLTK